MTSTAKAAPAYGLRLLLHASLLVRATLPCRITRDRSALPCRITRDRPAFPCRIARDRPALPCRITRDRPSLPCRIARPTAGSCGARAIRARAARVHNLTHTTPSAQKVAEPRPELGWPRAASVLGYWVGVRRLLNLSVFLAASRMVLPKILVLTPATAQVTAAGLSGAAAGDSDASWPGSGSGSGAGAPVGVERPRWRVKHTAGSDQPLDTWSSVGAPRLPSAGLSFIQVGSARVPSPAAGYLIRLTRGGGSRRPTTTAAPTAAATKAQTMASTKAPRAAGPDAAARTPKLARHHRMMAPSAHLGVESCKDIDTGSYDDPVSDLPCNVRRQGG